MKEDKPTEEYLARNLDVARAYGLNAGLVSIIHRVRRRKDCPSWLLASLQDCISRSAALIGPLANYRDDALESQEAQCPHIETSGTTSWCRLAAQPQVPEWLQPFISDQDGIEGVLEWAKNEDQTINLGNVTGEGDCLLESSAGWVARLLKAMLTASQEQVSSTSDAAERNHDRI